MGLLAGELPTKCACFPAIDERNPSRPQVESLRHIKNQKKVLIPFVEEIVPLVDIKNNFLIINPPEGLLELHI